MRAFSLHPDTLYMPETTIPSFNVPQLRHKIYPSRLRPRTHVSSLPLTFLTHARDQLFHERRFVALSRAQRHKTSVFFCLSAVDTVTQTLHPPIRVPVLRKPLNPRGKIVILATTTDTLRRPFNDYTCLLTSGNTFNAQQLPRGPRVSVFTRYSILA
uniref:RNA helicase n=1 Tax=Panagrellus redivivus TaxID=6233 RepID=A0A7E4VJB9_PANRE